ncbi:uncharacterized protein LOC115837968 [Nomascus leucogenys]|uniref:uncharacterized protein LOC115837968 n=1 Tax=Nomascus leucogenys TaxID=61853 RepID=UPI00122D7C6E|nr:uncharacterized protein LOC115837968 [Nomascus leucogenys]
MPIPVASTPGGVFSPGRPSVSCDTPIPAASAQPGTKNRESYPSSAFQPPNPRREGARPGWDRSQPHFRRLHSPPGRNPFQQPPSRPINAAARSASRGDILARTGIKSEIQAREAKAAGPPGWKKTAGGWRMRCAGISPRTLAVFCSPFRKVALYLHPPLQIGARPRAQLPAGSLRPRQHPHTTGSAYRPLPGPRGPRGDLLKPTRLLRASPDAYLESGGRQSSQNAREKSGRQRSLS